MQTVWISTNPLQLSKWEEHQTEDIRDLLIEKYAHWPTTGRIYHKVVAQSNDVTPDDEDSINALAEMEGPFFVVVYPADPTTVLVAAAIYTIAGVAEYLLRDDTRKPREHIFGSVSPTNALSQRTNRARLNERVSDSYGTCRSVPDFIQYPYLVWERDNVQIEYNLMCVGYGSYNGADVRDGDMPVESMRLASAQMFPPGQTPGIGTPSLVVGEAFTEPVYSVYPVKGFNDLPVAPINAFYMYGDAANTSKTKVRDQLEAQFFYDGPGVGRIKIPTTGDPTYVTSRILIGEELQIIWGIVEQTVNPLAPDLTCGFKFGALWPGGVFQGVPDPARTTDLEPVVVTSVTVVNEQVVEVGILIPVSLRPQWEKITPYTGGPGIANQNTVICTQSRWLLGYNVGDDFGTCGLFIDDPDQQEVWINFVARNNMYLEDGSNRRRLKQKIEIRCIPVDEFNVLTGDPPEFGEMELVGSVVGGEVRAFTMKFTRLVPGRCRLLIGRTGMRIRQADLNNTVTSFFRTRTIALDADVPGDGPDKDPFPRTAFGGSVIDDIVVEQCYSMSVPVNPDFSLVTTIQTRTQAVNQLNTSRGARQLNLRTTRLGNSWNGATFSAPLVPQVLGENMLFHALKDPFIGNRPNSEIDFVGIAAAFQAVRDSFGDNDATEFSYTFDDTNISIEETIATIGQACFVIPYRQAQIIKCDPEIATDESHMIFNHRNKKPGTEVRTVTFGFVGDNDGTEQTYIDVNTGIDTFSPYPQDLSQFTSFFPLKSRIVGLRHRHQAAWHAFRQLGRMTHQHYATDFECMEEAATLILKQRVLCEDNTDPVTQDGHITYVDGFVIGTSQPVEFDPAFTYTVYLQHTDETVELVPCTAGPDNSSITLGSALASPIVSLATNGVPAFYILAQDQDSVPKAFLVMDKQHVGQKTYSVSLINYSFMYYHADGLVLYIQTDFDPIQPFQDRSPYGRINNGDASDLGTDALRGPIWQGSPSSTGILVSYKNVSSFTVGYTKTCWVNKDTGSGNGSILGSTNSDAEFFAVSAAVVLRAGHGVVHVATSSFSINVWHFCCVTYDAVTQVMRLYLDGELVDEATGVPNSGETDTTAFSGGGSFGNILIGKADALRAYCKVLSPAMIRELYQKELLVP